MSIATITAAQRVELRDACLTAALAMQRFTQSATTPRTDETAEVTPVLNDAAAALTVAGASGLPATSAVVANGATINVENSAGNLDSPATATVAASAVTNVRLAATKTIVTTADAVTMQNSAGTAIPGTHAATVAAGVLSNVKLAATVGVVVNAVKQSGWTVTGTGTFFTPTIVAGVCTGGVLSAS